MRVVVVARSGPGIRVLMVVIVLTLLIVVRLRTMAMVFAFHHRAVGHHVAAVVSMRTGFGMPDVCGRGCRHGDLL
jgi:hypothetical protein